MKFLGRRKFLFAVHLHYSEIGDDELAREQRIRATEGVATSSVNKCSSCCQVWERLHYIRWKTSSICLRGDVNYWKR